MELCRTVTLVIIAAVAQVWLYDCSLVIQSLNGSLVIRYTVYCDYNCYRHTSLDVHWQLCDTMAVWLYKGRLVIPWQSDNTMVGELDGRFFEPLSAGFGVWHFVNTMNHSGRKKASLETLPQPGVQKDA